MYFLEKIDQTSHRDFGFFGDDRDKRLRELATWPDKAHEAFKRLGPMQRNLVVLQMAAKYGSEFAKKFLAQVGKRKPKEMVSHYYGRGVGPKPPSLMDRGYKLAQKDSIHEWWVHPTGEEVVRNYSDDPKSATSPAPTQTAPAPKPTTPPPSKPRPAECQEIDVLADSICYNADRICKIAADLNDDYSRAKCESARASCSNARRNASNCI